MGRFIRPSPDHIAIPASVEAKSVATTPNVFSSFSPDVSAAFLVPYLQLDLFLGGIQEIPAIPNGGDDIGTQYTWSMDTPRTDGSRATVSSLVSFLDRIKHADTADIAIMALGYLSMCRVQGKIPGYVLEKTMDNERVSRLESFTRAVKIRRAAVSRTASTMDITSGLERSKLAYQNYNYTLVHGACCESVIGYLPLPLGLAGSLVVNGQSYFIPMATTEGVLIASASRGLPTTVGFFECCH